MDPAAVLLTTNGITVYITHTEILPVPTRDNYGRMANLKVCLGILQVI